MGLLGAKTNRLKELKDLGLNVPKFAAIDNKKILAENFSTLANDAHNKLSCKHYAVRSSALVEDSANQSFAGQFETKLDVKPEDLAEAIKAVADQAKDFLKGDLSKFSIIIQEFISPDFSGVTFTRNPLGGREMIVEYHKGVGEELVSGRIKPEKKEFYWHQQDLPLPNAKKTIEAFQKIEKHYKFPQDVEWCIKGGEWFFLQTRPITTIDETEYKKSLYLDETLPKDKKFHYEKTEISEIAPRPTQITKDLLEMIYGQDGPIKKVYAKYGISYEPKDILQIIGNELFIDRLEERETILPQTGLFRSIKNTLKLGKIPLDGYEELYKRIKARIESKDSGENALEVFLKDYELVFEVNFLTGYAFQKIKDKSKLAEIVSGEIGIDWDIKLDAENLKGNALEIADESDFVYHAPKCSGDLPEGEEKYAVIYNQLREFSRWLVVKNINLLRGLIMNKASDFKDKKLVYFATLEEVARGELSEETCKKRADAYKKFDAFTFPSKLTEKPIVQSTELLAVSLGEAEGTLVDVIKNDGSKQILYTQNLEPSLAKHLSQIKGVVSEHGSMLSHLAIIAREEDIPVVVNFSLKNSGLKIGDKIKIQNDPTKVLSV